MNDLSLPLHLRASSPRKPVILVPACNRMLGEHAFHIAGKKYLDAAVLAGGMPLIVPSVEPADIEALLDLADGVLLTGSPSNVHPSHYGQQVHNPELPQDVLRDSWTLPLIRAVVERGMPIFAICRGFQEANVALGGSLYQAVQEVAGYNDHRARDGAPADEAYGPAHLVHAVAGGRLAGLVGSDSFTVNSVHGQAVNRLADGLRVEATAPDGLVEAFSIARSPGFSLCVQWHPEWQAAQNPQSVAMLAAFGQACAEWRDRHRLSTSTAR